MFFFATNYSEVLVPLLPVITFYYGAVTCWKLLLVLTNLCHPWSKRDNSIPSKFGTQSYYRNMILV